MSTLRLLDQIEEPGTRFKLGECIGSGIRAKVYEATDTKQSNKKVAIKVQALTPDNEICVQEELRILKQFSNHPNLPEFYGIFKKTSKNGDAEIWFVMELCEGGSVMDIVRKLQNKNRRMQEEHIAFILKETLNALAHLHRNHIIHRNICGDNILLTKEGEIKLVDFGLARSLSDALGKRHSCIGSPCYLAPEVVACSEPESENSYESRSDVWALGITAIELGDGKPPLYGMHPTRILFQIVRNPPPGLYRPGNWSEPYNDFISECLEKNPDYRPFMEELSEHPFFSSISENCYYLNQELKKLIDDVKNEEKQPRQKETLVKDNMIITDDHLQPVKMVVEDLAALENIDEDRMIEEIKARYMNGNCYSFIGDILLVLNPNEAQDLYDEGHHIKYNLKSRSSNPPHIYSIADRAYQDALHQEVPQQILLSGESGSGKTTAMKHLIDHLLFMGQSKIAIGNCIEDALKVIHALTNASTKNNIDSTRCVMKTTITYGASGKVSGAIFHVWQLEKWRISSTDLSQSNFHILYYFYDALSSNGNLNKYSLDTERNYRYFRVTSDDNPNLSEPRNNPEKNVRDFKTIVEYLKAYDFTDDKLETIYKTLAAILNIGEIRFKDNYENKAEIENKEVCTKVAELLSIDEKKLIWALTNYCFIEQGSAVKRKNTSNQARDARDMFANCIYARLVDWIVNMLNAKMARGRAMYGEKYSVNIYDYFGFECFKRNDLEQLLVNTFNEQIQYLYVNRVFAWETLELTEEDIQPPVLNYYNNKRGVDMLLGKPSGLLSLIEAGSKSGHQYQHILDTIEKCSNKSPHINTVSEKDFSFSHYTGKVCYDVREMAQKNRDFLSPEIIDTLRLSNDQRLREFFSGKLTKTGNLICKDVKIETSKWNAALIAEHEKQKNLSSDTQYSQTKQLRTAITTFRSVSLEMLRELSVGAGSGATHFVKCIRSNLTDEPRTFHKELIRHQLRALSILDTVRARQHGFPHRITFPEFLRRYQFLAFDFEETVDITQENCRLLLIRLKMEGWVIGRSKVFLKYYNEEYLSRLYETQVKKIIKIQCMMRAFMARKNVASKLKALRNKSAGKKLVRQATGDLAAEAAAALLIQKAYRGYNVRKKYGPLVNKESGQLDTATANFIKPFAKKWKNKSMFQVLLQYRSAKFQDLINFSQQIHIFNQNLMHEIQKCNEEVDLKKIDQNAKPETWLGEKKPTVWKMPFRFDEIPYYDTEHMCDASGNVAEDQEQWDSPLEWRRSIINEMKSKDCGKPVSRATTPNVQPCTTDQALLNMPYTRDPYEPINHLPRTEPIATSSTSKNTSYKPIGRIQPPATQVIISPKNIRASSFSVADKNFEGANQDFEFIRLSDPANKLKKRNANPIAELESIGRKNADRNDDEPPFNFQGMLRKTNFQRESFKRASERVEVSFNKMEKNRINRQNADVICTEILPGVILEGFETNI